MSHYSIENIGPVDSWHALEGQHGMNGKLFLEGLLGSENVGVSVNGLAPGGSSPFWHLHAQLEEVYIFLGGEGKMALGDEVIDVTTGSVVRVAPNTMMAVHANADSPTDLRFVCTRAGAASLRDVGDDAEITHDPFPWS
ncbi:cupin domain-containing protein [Microbacterium sp. G2-8]|uniref:cupin domain-containing protein n=1 Tax=Microbacterium sp. G2-8 TaxID=2842454 RepID=UPI001C88FEA5|nr:cupin domain-containing protein [Microbacterium sp. G2-8]